MSTIAILQISCSNECENENPTLVLVNNGTDKADIQIKTSGGNTENINNIEPGTSSEKRSFARGDIEFTISIKVLLKILFTSFQLITVQLTQ